MVIAAVALFVWIAALFIEEPKGRMAEVQEEGLVEMNE